MLFLSKANEFSSQNIPKTEKWKHTVKTTRKPSVPPSVPELAQASAIFVKKMKKTFPKKKSSGIPPASLSVPELAQASAKNAGKNMKCMDFPLKVVFGQFSFWCFFSVCTSNLSIVSSKSLIKIPRNWGTQSVPFSVLSVPPGWAVSLNFRSRARSSSEPLPTCRVTAVSSTF